MAHAQKASVPSRALQPRALVNKLSLLCCPPGPPTPISHPPPPSVLHHVDFYTTYSSAALHALAAASILPDDSDLLHWQGLVA
jgi:hypothetical protein